MAKSIQGVKYELKNYFIASKRFTACRGRFGLDYTYNKFKQCNNNTKRIKKELEIERRNKKKS